MSFFFPFILQSSIFITEYTQSGNGRYLAIFHLDGKISQGWCTPTPFHYTIITITNKVAVYAPAERADTLPLFHLYVLYDLHLATVYLLYKYFSSILPWVPQWEENLMTCVCPIDHQLLYFPCENSRMKKIYITNQDIYFQIWKFLLTFTFKGTVQRDGSRKY